MIEAISLRQDAGTLALVDRCVAGDEQAQAALYRAYVDTVYRLALWLLGEPSEAEEVAQDVFVRAFRALGRYDPARASLGAWLRAITLNRCRNARRRRRLVQVPWELVAEHVALRVDPGPDADLRQALWDGLGRLSEKQRTALVLRYFEGLTYAEIAETLDCPVGPVASRMGEGLVALRRLLETNP
jgi:RNA polymerase sigma-70 factor (ECF subfamily)